MHEVYLYKKLPHKAVQCLNCNHYCVIKDGERGLCGVKKNIDGKLYSLVYGKIAALNIDPIEKKPFFHFLPGTFSLSIGTVGCNFSCLNCQNWEISQEPRFNKEIIGKNINPREIVNLALQNHLPSISYTYNSPTVFSDFAFDTMKIAKEKGLKNCWVSNGFMSKELLKMISPYLDAINVDIKAFSEQTYKKYFGGRLKPILDNLKIIKQSGIWLEVTTLVIPGISDSKMMFKKIATFIKNELGENTPWHITRFSGAISWRLQNIADTPIDTLKMAYDIGKKTGLNYVYIGNVPGLNYENTYCPKCGALMIERHGYSIKRYDNHGKCSKCGANLNIIDE